jgi:hypothetical protein
MFSLKLPVDLHTLEDRQPTVLSAAIRIGQGSLVSGKNKVIFQAAIVANVQHDITH